MGGHVQKKNSIAFLEEMSSMYGIYILSNVSKYVLNYIMGLDFFRYVHGGTYSYEIGFCKPEPEIYEVFFNRHNLKPEEGVFFDDLPANIEEALKKGMHGIVFHDNLQEIRNFLKTMH